MKRPPRAFTLIELLVVITIIGMLVGMLLPAVNAARESGRRAVCLNNLHQLATACAGHVIKLGFYPSGGWGSSSLGDPNKGTGSNQPGGWIYQILPYMDQDALHDLGKGNLAGSATASVARVQTALPVLYCPTRRSAQTYPGGGGSTGAMLTGRTDYVINGGTVCIQNSQSPPPATFVGIACSASQITDAMIPDNKGTTYLMGEKYMSPENYITGQDLGDLNCAMSGDDISLIRWGSTTLLPNMDRPASSNPPSNATQIFGSSHGAGWHVAFCDGHVQLIGWGMDSGTHQAMATRNGHEVIDPTKIQK